MEVIDPDARIADLVGLLYVLHHIFKEKTDIYELEKEMEVDIDDLMPIIYTASNIGLIETDQGDIWITEKGKTFISSSPRNRKEILKGSIINMEPIATALKLKEFDLEGIMEELAKEGIQKYNSPTGYHNLEVTLIEWGVYSGIIKKTEDGFIASL
ncbi:AAA-associated domain-containing protein [Cuniculiplasma sp. SKW3]|uniref:AAA-associated domain-containing protein n=1 Tax=unclassified Cuniculiplasma TaxID=2619706 RepID=UPI003FD61BF7